MRVLVLGGTGAIGQHLVSILASQGHRVYVTSRRDHEDEFNVSYIQGNAHNNNFIQGILKNHYDAIIDFMSYPISEFTKEKATCFLRNTGQYFFMSSSRVYDNVNGLITEDSPRLLDVSNDNEFLSTNEYSLMKAKEENILMNMEQHNWTILRPYISYAEDRLQLGAFELEAWLPRVIKGKSIAFSYDILDKETTLTYGKDVAFVISKMLSSEKSKGEIFNTMTSEHVKWSNVLRLYIEHYKKFTGRNFNVVYTQESVVCKIKDLKYQIIYDRALNRCFDNSKLFQFCPDIKFTPTSIGLTDCFMKHLLKPHKYSLPVKMEAIQDKVTGERVVLNEYPSYQRKLGYLFYRYNPFI